MIVIPAVDIKNGKCVRLEQGRMDAETVFSDDPVAIARQWDAAGAEIIHIIDLDGAVMVTTRRDACSGAIGVSPKATHAVGRGPP